MLGASLTPVPTILTTEELATGPRQALIHLNHILLLLLRNHIRKFPAAKALQLRTPILNDAS
jgi:hypothetical protein